MPGIDMLVKFGYCLICDNGPDKKNRSWVEDLIKTGTTVKHTVTHCNNCGGSPTGVEAPNKNLLRIEVKVTGLY